MKRKSVRLLLTFGAVGALAIARERTITAAAQAADFADAAHVTRTFYQMFGIPPSTMMQGDFFEISSPFELAR